MGSLKMGIRQRIEWGGRRQKGLRVADRGDTSQSTERKKGKVDCRTISGNVECTIGKWTGPGRSRTCTGTLRNEWRCSRGRWRGGDD